MSCTRLLREEIDKLIEEQSRLQGRASARGHSDLEFVEMQLESFIHTWNHGEPPRNPGAPNACLHILQTRIQDFVPFQPIDGAQQRGQGHEEVLVDSDSDSEVEFLAEGAWRV